MFNLFFSRLLENGGINHRNVAFNKLFRIINLVLNLFLKFKEFEKKANPYNYQADILKKCR